jgi:hypothetical protein
MVAAAAKSPCLIMAVVTAGHTNSAPLKLEGTDIPLSKIQQVLCSPCQLLQPT